MSYSTKFSDYESNPKDLIGKKVLQSCGTSYGGTSKSIETIVSVTKASFKISGEGNENSLYYLNTGQLKGMSGRMDIGRINECKLITEEYADQLVKIWAENKEKKVLFAKVEESFEIFKKQLNLKITSVSKEKLEKLIEVLKS